MSFYMLIYKINILFVYSFTLLQGQDFKFTLEEDKKKKCAFVKTEMIINYLPQSCKGIESKRKVENQ